MARQARRLPRMMKPHQWPDLLSPGQRVFLQAGGSESAVARDALMAAPETCAGVRFTSVLIPNINGFDYAGLHPQARLETFLLSPALRASFAAGRIDLRPFHYRRIYDYLAEGPAFDLAIVQVAPPDARGRCSLGITADFAPAVLAKAKCIIAHVNPLMPRTHGPHVAWSRIDVAIEAEQPLPEFPTGAIDPVSRAVGERAAALIEDGDTLQYGVGKVPAAVLGLLRDRRRLGIHSGLVTDELVDLIAAGCVTGQDKSRDRRRVVTGCAFGTRRLYDFVADDAIRFHPVGYTHDAPVLADQHRLVSINSAIEVDLFGQCNGEMVGGRQISGTGGALDFVQGARRSKGGRSIIALPATTPKGDSRIAAAFAPGTVVTLPRAETDIVVTEHGQAVIRGLSVDERAEALIAIAAPEHRAALADRWRDIRQRL